MSGERVSVFGHDDSWTDDSEVDRLGLGNQKIMNRLLQTDTGNVNSFRLVFLSNLAEYLLKTEDDAVLQFGITLEQC